MTRTQRLWLVYSSYIGIRNMELQCGESNYDFKRWIFQIHGLGRNANLGSLLDKQVNAEKALMTYVRKYIKYIYTFLKTRLEAELVGTYLLQMHLWNQQAIRRNSPLLFISSPFVHIHFKNASWGNRNCVFLKLSCCSVLLLNYCIFLWFLYLVCNWVSLHSFCYFVLVQCENLPGQ